MPKGKSHRWLRSMTSSQALALSIFGNLQAFGKLGCLMEIKGDDDKPLFIRAEDNINSFMMEKEINYLGEKKRKSNIDVFFGGVHQIAVECKFSERKIGPCSRPNLGPSNSNYEEDYCDGRFIRRRNTRMRSALNERKIQHWEHIPKFFRSEQWDPDVDHDPCPLNPTYQIVRNVLAAGLKAREENKEIRAVPTDGHTVLVYDEQNPEFFEGGKGHRAYHDVKNWLLDKAVLRKCTWQQVISVMTKDKELDWLINGLKEKYGLVA